MLFRKCLTGFGNTKRYCHQLNRCRKNMTFQMFNISMKRILIS